jgi:predicted DNA-binding protein (MmcQ/YjbR family)
LEANHEISVLSGAVIYISETGNYLGRSFPITTVSLIKKKLLNSGSVINHPSVMMRKSDFDKVGGYSELIGDKFTDYHLWVKFVTKGYKIKNLPEVFLKYRIIQSSISSSFYLTKKGTEVLLKTIKIEFPTAQEVDLLKKSCQLSKESFAKRERTYKNLPNHIYEKLSFIGQKTRNNLFSGFQNLIAIFR